MLNSQGSGLDVPDADLETDEDLVSASNTTSRYPNDCTRAGRCTIVFEQLTQSSYYHIWCVPSFEFFQVGKVPTLPGARPFCDEGVLR